MGDRANARFMYDEGKEIYLYAHWDGVRLADVVQDACNGKVAQRRRGDPSYFTRIVIQQSLNALGADPNRDTGYGIAPWQDDGDVVIEVNAMTGTCERKGRAA